MLPAVERWERDQIERQLASLERAQRRLEETNQEAEKRLWGLESREGMRLHLSYTVVFWATLAAFVALEIVAITLRASAS
jgi:hypothetical protein